MLSAFFLHHAQGLGLPILAGYGYLGGGKGAVDSWRGTSEGTALVGGEVRKNI